MQNTFGPWIPDLASSAVLLLYWEDLPLPSRPADQTLPHTHLLAGDAQALAEARLRTGATTVVISSPDGVSTLLDGGRRIQLAPAAAADRCLASLLSQRRWWLRHRELVPIVAHSLLSDQRTCALIDHRGSLVWLCLPRIDSSAMFASLLADASRGVFSVSPRTPSLLPTQSYLEDSLILRTQWDSLSLTDYLDCSGGRPFQRAGRSDLIRVLEGPGVFRVVFRPRLDFGRAQTHLIHGADGLQIDGWVDPAVLRSPGITWTIETDGKHQTASADIDTSAGPVVLELRYGTANITPSIVPEPTRREQTLRFWNGWARSLTLPGVANEAVKRSALVLKALCHGPSGAIAAAGTTSLPEHLGGVRNWDYRFCWLRDACMSASSLTRLGNSGVALKLLDWLMEVTEATDSPERLRPLYTVTGGHLNPEAEISDLAGYGGSKPVRIGNAASTQVQLDVFGPIVDLVARIAEMGAPVTPDHWRLVESMVNAVAARWTEPDHGIWEIRGDKRHHVHTKAMCWLAADRGLVVAERAMGFKRPAWRELRDAIASDIHANGLLHGSRALVGSYSSTDADAATLLALLSGAVGTDPEIMTQTVNLVRTHLQRGPVVDRYRYDDGLPGREGGWLICAYWLVEALAVQGNQEEAALLFDQIGSLAGPTGLLSEEFDPETGLWLGNFPQAYSHLGQIDAAVRLAGRPNK